MSQAGSPRLAAGVVVRRRRDGAIYMGSRTDQARSWPGTMAFPGGGVDDDDWHLPLMTGADGREGAFRAGALREAFEEAGLMSVCHPDGSACGDDVVAAIVKDVHAGASFDAALSAAHVVLDDRPLLSLGAWLTAEGSFLVARFLWPVDDVQVHEPPTAELADLRFYAPTALMAGWRDGSVFLPPPMRIQLGRLADLREGASDADVADVLREYPSEQERRRRELIAGVVIIDPKTPTLWPATRTNCVVLGCGDVLLVDPATPYDDERAAFDEVLTLSLGHRKVRGIMLTHHHADHVGDAARLREKHGCPIHAHQATADRLGGTGITVDVVIDDGYVFHLDGDGYGPDRHFTALHTPGHAQGHLCLYDASLRLLVAGDMIAGVGSILIDPPEGHLATYMASMARLVSLNPRSLIPAHGPLLTDAVPRLQAQIAHRQARTEKVLQAIRDGAVDVAAIVAAAYDGDIPAAMVPFAERQVVAIAAMLVDQGHIAERGRHFMAT
jgi:glyoxylase-like metal-dependent hydrolase (beta-lactamase superfamily II)/8-oxo-dGTP pyrophosphatase MutT (NUDIX family)